MHARAVLRAPAALAFYLGAGQREREDGRGRIVMLHGTPRHRAGALERLLRYLARHFDVVPLAQLAREAASGAPLRRRAALTFDDGLRNNVEVAYPVLKRLGLPATFFVCPGLIGTGRWLWTQEVRQRLARLSHPPAAIEAMLRQMKALPLHERWRREDEIRALTPDFVPTAAERHEFDLAGWDDLKALDPALVTVGSHTLTHPMLTSVDAQALERELGESRRLLERELGRPAAQFAYPNGGTFDPALVACVRRHYELAVTVDQGFVGPGADVLQLSRVHAPWNPLRFAAVLHRDPRPSSSSPRSAGPAATSPAPETP